MKFVVFYFFSLALFGGTVHAQEYGKGKFTNNGNHHWLINTKGAVFIRTDNVGGIPYAKSLAEQCVQGRSIKIVTGLSTYVAPEVEKNCQVFRSGHPQASPSQDTMIVSGHTLIVNGDIYTIGGSEVIQEYEFMRHLSISAF